MDWNIEKVNKLVYDKELDTFVKNQIVSIENVNNREAKEELDDLKSKVLKKERYYFFK